MPAIDVPFRTKLIKAEAQIASAVCATKGRIYTRAELAEHFSKLRRKGVLATHTKLPEFLDFLVLRRHLMSVTLKSKRYGKQVTRYCVGPPSPFALAASLRKKGYLSHGTAAYLHKLVKRMPDVIHLNVEQSAKTGPQLPLSQAAIERAFSGKQRQSNLSYENREFRVTILAGKNTGRAGVEPIEDSTVRGIPVTNLERTLIDIAVRPAYAGGIDQVLEAFRAARERASTQKLVSILDSLRHAYPYAQAIGFLMQRAGFPKEHVDLLRPRVSEFKFYLAHALKDPGYDDGWRLFYPSSFPDDHREP